MKALTSSVAKILYAIPFGIFGIMHLLHANDMAGMVPIPGGVFWIYLTGLAMLAACISIITGKMARVASLLLALLLLIYILTVHLPGIMNPDQQMMQMSMMNLLKDMSLMAGALLVAGMHSES